MKSFEQLKIEKMKVLVVLCIFVLLNYIEGFEVEDGLPHFDMDQDLSAEDVEKLLQFVDEEKMLYNLKHEQLGEIDIKVNLNEFLDRFLANAQKMIIEKGLDPTTLPDQYIDIKIGHSTLTQGQLNDTSSIMRYEDAIVTYNSESKQVVLDMVLRFEDLKFLYKYHTKVTLISMTGHLHGDIEHIHIHVKFGFDFATGLFFVDSIDFKHTGEITLYVSGNAAIDWITNSMSFVITGILHNLILDIVRNIVAGPLNSIVDQINEILHPTGLF